MKPVSVFVPGKVLLSGEHSVVYGYPALAASIDKGVRVEVVEAEELTVKSNGKDGLDLIKKAITLVSDGDTSIKLTIESDLPVGSGLGSSAAVSAAVIKAVAEYMGRSLTKKRWFGLTMECERVAHANASGVDPAAVIYGGLLHYVREKPIKHLYVTKPRAFRLVQSGKPEESTGEMVLGVKEKVESRPEMTNRILKRMGEVTKIFEQTLLQDHDLTGIINENGVLLEALGVVGERAIGISRELRAQGFGVKVVGAGGVRTGSGMLLVYHTDLEKASSIVHTYGSDCISISVGGGNG